MQERRMAGPRLVTAEELQRFPSADNRYELVLGRIVPMSPVGFPHATAVVRLIELLGPHIRRAGLGVVATELGFKLTSNPDTVRAPDVAFIRRERVPLPAPQGFWQGAPDLAIEVLSPDDRDADVREKIHEYHAHGVSAVLIVDPQRQTVTVVRSAGKPDVLGAEQTLDLSDVVAGFRCGVRDIFT
jgi:Uma2 family endonuclease